MMQNIIVVITSLLLVSPAWAGTIVRSDKACGGTAFCDDTLATADEVNDDFDRVYNEFNGNIDNDNMDASAAIHGSKLDQTPADGTDAATDGIDADIIDDYSADDVEADNSENPGTAEINTLATNLQEEIAQLRYKIEQLVVGTSATDFASGTGTDSDAHWVDGPIRPGNHIYNGGFDAWQIADCVNCGSAEGEWEVVLAPNLADTAKTEADGAGHGMGMLITSVAAGLEGIKQTIDGLKADTSYLATATVKPTTGDSCRITTTGADANDLTIDSVGDNAFEVLAGIFETDSTPTDVVLSLKAVADGDICLFDHVGVFEINTDPAPLPPLVVVQDCATADHAVDADPPEDFDTNSVEVAVTPPGPGYIVETFGFAAVEVVSAGGANENVELAIDENGTDKANGVCGLNPNVAGGLNCSIALNYVNNNPTPGTALTYKLQLGDYGGNDSVYDTSESDACITVRMSRGF